MKSEMFMLLFEIFWENEFTIWRDQGIGSGIPGRIKDEELEALKPKARQIFLDFWNFMNQENLVIGEGRTLAGNGKGTLTWLLERCIDLDNKLRKKATRR